MRWVPSYFNAGEYRMAYQQKDLWDLVHLFEEVVQRFEGKIVLSNPSWWDGSGERIDVLFCAPYTRYHRLMTIIALDHPDSVGPAMDFLRRAGVQAFHDNLANSDTKERWL